MKKRIRKTEKWTWQSGHHAQSKRQRKVVPAPRGSAPSRSPASKPALPRARPSRHPCIPQRFPHLGHADHPLGHVQVALVVLADLGNDKAWVLSAHPAPGTQLQLQRHRGRSCSRAPRPAWVWPPPPLVSRVGSPAGPHIHPATSARGRRAANHRAPPRSQEKGAELPAGRAASPEEEVQRPPPGLGVWLPAGKHVLEYRGVPTCTGEQIFPEGGCWLPSQGVG